MKQKICILFSLGFIIILFSLSRVFGQTEKDIMKRYDYSSPKASFESLKKAILERDIEGIIIHEWQVYRWAEGSRYYGKSFEDALTEFQPKTKSTNMFDAADQIWTNIGPIKVTEFDFIKELERTHEKSENIEATYCFILLKKKNNDLQTEAFALNYDKTKEWWTSIQRYGE